MSTYDMVCTKCQHTFEVYRQGFLRDEDKVCPECGSTETQLTFKSFLRHFGTATTSSNCGPRMGGFG